MKKILPTVCLAAALMCGCSSTSSATATAVSTLKSDREVSIATYDEEAAALGFPEKFISKEQENIDWSQATADRVEGMEVEVYDTGVTVEVCGGLSCDK